MYVELHVVGSLIVCVHVVGSMCVPVVGRGAGRVAIDVRGRERSRVLCFYGVSDVAACWNPRGMVPVR